MSTIPIDQDTALLSDLRLGDDRALSKLYDRYWMKLLVVARNRLNNEIEAEECVQDVFIGLWRNREKITINHSLNAYLFKSVRNQVMNRLAMRYTKKHNVSPPELLISDQSPDARLLEKDLTGMVEKAIDMLPEKCKLVYRMSRMEGKTNKTISAELNISEKTVEGHITRALSDLRKSLLTSPTIVIWTAFEWYFNTILKK